MAKKQTSKEKNIAYLHNFNIALIAIGIFIFCIGSAFLFGYLLYDCFQESSTNLYNPNVTSNSYQPVAVCNANFGGVGAGAVIFTGVILIFIVAGVLLIIGLIIPQHFYNARKI